MMLGDVQAMGALMSWPTFSLSSYSIVSSLKRHAITPRTVLDIGANRGQFAVAAAKLFPGVQVHSFEPLPDCVMRLRRNVRNLDNVAVYALALGDSLSEQQLHVNSHRHASSILPLAKGHRLAFPQARELNTIPIHVSTLDTVFSEKKLDQPCLLKLDVQGYEAHVLRGGEHTLKRVDYVVVETSFTPMYEGETLFMDLVGFMDKHGFRFLYPVGWLVDPKTDEVLQIDALFARQR